MSEKPEGLQVRKVLARDGTNTVLFGFRLEDFFAMMLALLVCVILALPKIWMLVVLVSVWLWIKKVKAKVPDHYIRDMLNFLFRKNFHYRASEPDTLIAPYIVPEK